MAYRDLLLCPAATLLSVTALAAPALAGCTVNDYKYQISAGLQHATVEQGAFAKYTGGVYSNSSARDLAGVYFSSQVRFTHGLFAHYDASVFSSWFSSLSLVHQTAGVGWSFGLGGAFSAYLSAGAEKHSAARKNVDYHFVSEHGRPTVEKRSPRHSEIGPMVGLGACWQVSERVQLLPTYQGARLDGSNMSTLELEGQIAILQKVSLMLAFQKREWGNADDSGWRAGLAIDF